MSIMSFIEPKDETRQIVTHTTRIRAQPGEAYRRHAKERKRGQLSQHRINLAFTQTKPGHLFPMPGRTEISTQLRVHRIDQRAITLSERKRPNRHVFVDTRTPFMLMRNRFNPRKTDPLRDNPVTQRSACIRIDLTRLD